MPEPAEGIPEPEFWVLDAEAVPYATQPTLAFSIRAKVPEGQAVYTIALKAEIHVEPSLRTYDDETRRRLSDLFGDPDRWSNTTQNFLWTRADVLVPSFSGTTRFTLKVPCGSDLELGATKYFSGLPDGDAPLIFHLSGTILYSGPEDRLQVTQVPWSSSAEFKLPAATWQGAVAEHWPGGGFVRVSGATLDELQRYRMAQGLPSLEAAVSDLLQGSKLTLGRPEAGRSPQDAGLEAPRS